MKIPVILLLLPIVVAAQVHLNFTIKNHDDIKLPDSLIGIKKIITTKCDKSGECERIVSEYTRNGLLICETEYDEKGKPDGRKVYTYNDKMQLVMYEDFDDDNKLSDKEVYTYNKMNQLEEFKDLGDNGKAERCLKLFYNEKNGELIKEVQYDETGAIVFSYNYSEYDHIKHTVKITQTDAGNHVVKDIRKEYSLFE